MFSSFDYGLWIFVLRGEIVSTGCILNSLCYQRASCGCWKKGISHVFLKLSSRIVPLPSSKTRSNHTGHYRVRRWDEDAVGRKRQHFVPSHDPPTQRTHTTAAHPVKCAWNSQGLQWALCMKPTQNARCLTAQSGWLTRHATHKQTRHRPALHNTEIPQTSLHER